ncbi:MAG TPA: hypothetical protein VFB66_16700 [Tepidisphaeraceae bacterium]|nr:hypothetical protein [Tepidisphaeraceae bacterium]
MGRRSTVVVVLTVLAAVALAAVAQETSDRRERRRDRDGRGRRDDRTGGVERYDARDGQPPQTGPAASGPSTGASGSTSLQAGRVPPMPAKYGVLLERSIFARGGFAARSTQPSTTQSASTAPVYSPQQQVLLLGVLCPDEQFIAFAENRSTGQVMILHQGDEVAQGRVALITLDSLTFAQGSKVTEIRVGQNLAGETVAPGLAGGTTGTSGGGTYTPTPPASPAEAALIEKLKAARKQSGG